MKLLKYFKFFAAHETVETDFIDEAYIAVISDLRIVKLCNYEAYTGENIKYKEGKIYSMQTQTKRKIM